MALAIFSVDQITKAWVTIELAPPDGPGRHEVIGNLVALEYVENTGAAFGILADHTWLLAALSVVIIGIFLVVLRERVAASLWWALAFSLVLGGALGNLIDRVLLGFVVDFVAVGSFPRFNVADSAITVGIIWLALLALREPDDEEPATESNAEETNEKDSA